MHSSFRGSAMPATASSEPHKGTGRVTLLWACCVVLISLLAISGCSDDLSPSESKEVNKALRDSLLSVTETWDPDLTLLEKGQKLIHLQGSYAASYDTDQLQETRIKGPVHLQVFDSLGHVTTRVSSNRAVYKRENIVFEFFGNVMVNTRDNRHLESEYLKWDRENQSISSDQFVIITTPTDSIAGKGFEGTPDLSEYTIRQVSGQVQIEQ